MLRRIFRYVRSLSVVAFTLIVENVFLFLVLRAICTHRAQRFALTPIAA